MSSARTPLFAPLARLKALFKRHYYFSDDDVIDVTLGTFAGNHFDGDPLWLHLISPPSSGKTELLLSTMECEDAYFLSDFSANTLISGYREQPRRKAKAAPPDPTAEGSETASTADESEAEPEDFSTLPLLNGKVLVTKDFTLIHQKPAESRSQILSILRDVYDGFASRDFGNSRRKSFHSRFNYLAGMTPDIEKSWNLLTLGERFLLYRISIQDRREHGRKAILNSLGTARRAKGADTTDGGNMAVRAEVQQAVKHFLGSLPKAEPDAPNTLVEQVLDLADLLSVCRTPVARDSKDEIGALPQPELAARVGKQLMRVCRSLCVVRGKPEVTEAEVTVAKRIALDSLPSNRRLLLRALWAHHEQPRDLKTFSAALSHLSESTVRRELENLALLGAVERSAVPVSTGIKRPRADGTTYEVKTSKDFYRLDGRFVEYGRTLGGL